MKSCLCVVVLVVHVGSDSTVFGQQATVDFESLVPNTTYGVGVNQPGDGIFSENGIAVSIERSLFNVFETATVDGWASREFPTTSMTIGNVNLRFDLTRLGFAAQIVSFEYTDLGGDEELGINGSVFRFDTFRDAEPSLNGVNVTVTETPALGGIKGTVTLEGSLNSVTIGGQEFAMDNFVVAIPEPRLNVVAMLLVAVAAMRRRSACGRTTSASIW